MALVECLTRDREAAGLSLTGVTALCPWARHINPSLVLVQPRKARPYITERLLMGHKESNKTKQKQCRSFCGISSGFFTVFISPRLGVSGLLRVNMDSLFGWKVWIICYIWSHLIWMYTVFKRGYRILEICMHTNAYKVEYGLSCTVKPV